MWWMLAVSLVMVCDVPTIAHAAASSPAAITCTVSCPPEANGLTAAPNSQSHARRYVHRTGLANLMNASPEDADDQRTWIGVVLTDVPPSVSAQIGDGGLLVTNVAKDSPADRAGIQQYDVIRSFNGKPVTDLDVLVDEITAVGAGNQTKVEIIRGAKSQALDLTPAQRARDATEFEYKYEMPEDVVDESSKIRGHALHRMPDGTWRLDDLGALDNLPQALQDLIESHVGRGHSYSWSWPKDGDPTFNFNWNMDDAQSGADAQFQIEVNRDGAKLAINRDASGAIRVDRTDKDGKVSSTSYDNADALKDGDAEAFELYQRMSHHQPMITIDPNPAQIDRLRSRYQDQINRHLNAARKRADEQSQRAKDNANDAQGQSQQRRAPHPQADQSDDTAAPKAKARAMHTPASGAMNVTIDKDGSIAITMEKDGQTIEYRFANEDDMQKREPKLYERYKKLRD